MQGLIGRKLGMTQTFTEDDQLVPVTVIQAGPCVIAQIKREETDGYSAVQIGFGDKKTGVLSKAKKGHFSNAGIEPVRYLREFRVDDPDSYKVGDVLTVDRFAEGERADISGWSKGKGFSGVIKRWNFKGGPGGHGSHFHRSPGSIGMAATPSRVVKGKKMPGQYGNVKNTITNLEIVKVDKDKNILLVKGAIPGASGALVLINKSNRAGESK